MNIKQQMNDRLEDLAIMFYGNSENDLEDLSEYGLELSYHDDDGDDGRPFWRYLLSTGGPTDYFDIFVGHNYKNEIDQIKYSSSYNDNQVLETIEVFARNASIWDIAHNFFNLTERGV
jgi:hypothetical protein